MAARSQGPSANSDETRVVSNERAVGESDCVQKATSLASGGTHPREESERQRANSSHRRAMAVSALATTHE